MAELRKPSLWRPCITMGIIVIIVCCCCWWWWWRCYPCTSLSCDCPDHVEVFIVELATGCGVEDGTGSGLMEIFAEPGDVVIWSNDTSDTTWVDFTPYATGTPFIKDVIMILPGTQQVTRVRDDAGGIKYDWDLGCGSPGGSGGPKVNVGGGPP